MAKVTDGTPRVTVTGAEVTYLALDGVDLQSTLDNIVLDLGIVKATAGVLPALDGSALTNLPGGGGGGGATNLSWTAATRVLASDTGSDATITLATTSDPGLMSSADKTKIDGVEALADVTDAANVNTAGAVMEADYTAQSLLRATTNGVPAPLTVDEQTLVGRITSGNIAALTPTQIRTLINVEDGATAGGGGGVSDYGDLTGIPAAIGAIDGLTPAANQIAYYTGATTAALTPLTAFGVARIGDADAAAALTGLGISGVLTVADAVEPAGSTVQKVDGTTNAGVWAEGVNSVPTVAEIIAGTTDGIIDGSVLRDITKPRFVTPSTGTVTIDALAGLNVWIIEGADNLTFVDDCWDNLPIHQVMSVTVIADADARTITFADPLVNLRIPSADAAPWNEVNCFKRFFFSWSPNTADVTLKDKRVVEFGGYLVAP